MPVFISYQQKDRMKAMEVANKLEASRIKFYLDVLDPVSQTTDNITEVITKRIVDSTHLIAVVSSNTQQSWWVPFEIGEATISDRRIASYQSSYVETPEYLKKWPVMKTTRHLDMFIQEYRRDSTTTQMASFSEAVGRRSSADLRKSAGNFHSSLKDRLQRGF